MPSIFVRLRKAAFLRRCKYLLPASASEINIPITRASQSETALRVCSPRGARGPQDVPGAEEQTQVEAESPFGASQC